MSNQFGQSNVLNNLCWQQQGRLATTSDLLTLLQYNFAGIPSGVNGQRPIQYNYVQDSPRPATETAAPLKSYAEHGNVYEVDESEVRVPCLAPAMSKDHDHKTAYLIYNKNTKHGDELLCSHTNCRNNGIHFLFCSYCKQPIPKRNFAKNHAHREESPAKDDSMDVYVTEDSESSKCSKIRKQSTSSKAEKSKFSKRKKKSKAKAVFANRGTPTLPPLNLDPSPKKLDREYNNQVMSEQNQRQQQNISSEPWPQESMEKSSDSLDNETPRVISKVEKSWLSLLEQRPPSQDTAAMCVWLTKVMSTSEDFEDITNCEE